MHWVLAVTSKPTSETFPQRHTHQIWVRADEIILPMWVPTGQFFLPLWCALATPHPQPVRQKWLLGGFHTMFSPFSHIKISIQLLFSPQFSGIGTFLR